MSIVNPRLTKGEDPVVEVDQRHVLHVHGQGPHQPPPHVGGVRAAADRRGHLSEGVPATEIFARLVCC